MGGQKLTEEMSIILSERFDSMIVLADAFQKANEYSVKICNVEGQPRHSRDEVDAIRHFIGASLLSANTDPIYARRLLTAHERRRDEFDEENIMDLNNNEVGFSHGQEIPKVFKEKRVRKAGSGRIGKVKYKSINDSIEYFREIVKEKILRDELDYLQWGNSDCTLSKLQE